jgi:hypothetical protein
MDARLTLLNFSHPLTEVQCAQIRRLTGQIDFTTRELPVSLNHNAPFAGQIAALLDSLALSATEWQTTPWLINPPGFAPAAATLIAELHGRIGHFPGMLRIRPIADSTPPRYEVAEIVNLQAVRDAARARRNGER